MIEITQKIPWISLNILFWKENLWKDREVKMKREIEELFFKPTTASIDDKHKFEQKKGRRKDQLKTLGMFFN